MRGASLFRSGFGPTVLLLAVATAVLVPLVVAGCGGSGGQTTTTVPVVPTSQASVTSSVPSTTGSTEVSTTTTTGIVITLPSTTSTAATTTTTEALSSAETRMPNGHIKAMGFIDKVYVKDGKRYVSIDYAEMLTGQKAIDAAVAAGEIQPGEDLPNDYFISNTNPQKRVFEVSGTAPITCSTWLGEMDKHISWDTFKSFWSATPPTDAGHLHGSPWWIERDGQTVVKIDEQYLP